MITIKVVTTSSYGNLSLYPANDNAAKLLSIAGRRTLKASDLARAEEFGMEVVIDGSSIDAALVRKSIAREKALWESRGKSPHLDTTPDSGVQPERS